MGAAYFHALMLRGIDVDGSELPSGIEVLLAQIHEDTSETHIPPSIFSTIWVRDTSPNEATFGLTLPFLVMEWIYTIPMVKLAINAQWNTLPLPASDQLILALPKPSLTLGIRMGAFGNGIKLASIPNYALPLPCDPTFAFPIITMESKAYDITDSRAQNLHNASVMLRNLSVVANMETIKVFTVSIGMTEIETRVHWITNSAQPEYHFATIGTVYLTNQPISWLKARKSLEPTVRFAYNSYVPILNSAIAEFSVGQGVRSSHESAIASSVY